MRRPQPCSYFVVVSSRTRMILSSMCDRLLYHFATLCFLPVCLSVLLVPVNSEYTLLPSLLTQQDAGSLSSSLCTSVALLQCARVAGKIRACSRARFISLSRSSSVCLHHRGHDIKWLFHRIGGSEPDLCAVQVFFEKSRSLVLLFRRPAHAMIFLMTPAHRLHVLRCVLN